MAAPSGAVARALELGLDGRSLGHAEIDALLRVDDPVTAEHVFAAARELRSRHFGRAVFLYGFVYFSTYCRNSCTFCRYRVGNDAGPRYRKSVREVVALATELAESGVHLVDLTMGEDPSLYGPGDFAPVVEMVRAVREVTALPVMVSPGVVAPAVLATLREAGAQWYACYQETHSPALFPRLRRGQSYRRRVEARAAARRLGLDVEDGMLLGVGEGIEDRVRSILDMRDQGARQVRVMGFVPQPGTPLAGLSPAAPPAEMMALATLRLVMPDRLIPASLDIEGLRGLRARLEAGANVVTSLIPPSAGLAGVSQATLDIEGGLRSVAGVREVLASLGLEAAAPEDYRRWVAGAAGREEGRSVAGAGRQWAVSVSTA